MRSNELERIADTPDVDGHLMRSGAARGFNLFSTGNSMIFGSKKEFVRRCKGLITNEQWKIEREHPLGTSNDLRLNSP